MKKLFPILLQGVGTEDVESLSSYLMRLSAAHGRSVRQFLRFLSHHSDAYEKDQPTPRYIGHQASIVTLSKANRTVEHLLKLLSNASNVTGLRASTLQCFSDSYKRMAFSISDKLRWCPRCMSEWEQNKETAYFKLVWLFNQAEYCHHHSVLLISQCPACKGPQSGFQFRQQLHKCDKCGASLGALTHSINMVSIKKRTAGDIFHLVEEIALNPDLTFFGSHGVRKILNTLDRRAERSDEAREVFNSLFPFYWKQFGSRSEGLTFEETRAFAAISGITLFDALQGNCIGQTRVISYSWAEGTRNQWKTEVRKRRDFETTKQILAKHLLKTKGTHPSLKSVAEAIGVSVGYLRYRFKSQAIKVTKEYQAHKKRVAESQRVAARKAAISYFLSTQTNDRRKSRKAALRELRTVTGLSKGLLRSQIAEVYETRCLRRMSTRELPRTNEDHTRRFGAT